MKIWFQNRRSKVKKLVRYSPVPSGADVTAAAAAAAGGGGGDDVKTDDLSTGSVDDDDVVDDDDDDGKHSDELHHHITATGSSPSPSTQQQLQLQQLQLLGHRSSSSSWEDLRSSFQRFPALTQLHYNHSALSGVCDDARLSAPVDSSRSGWSAENGYSSSSVVNRLQTTQCELAGVDSAVGSGGSHSVSAAAAAARYQTLLHGAAAVHPWYSATQTSPQTLLT